MKLKKNSWYVLIVCFLVFYVLISPIVGDLGIMDYLHLENRYENLTRQLLELEADNKYLKERIKSLKSDPAEWEKLAREKLDMVKKGDFTYKF